MGDLTHSLLTKCIEKFPVIGVLVRKVYGISSSTHLSQLVK